MELPEAVNQFIKPGMSIQFGNGMTTPTAIFFEIARQFWGKNPEFTLAGITGGAYNLALFVHGKLCKKIIPDYAIGFNFGRVTGNEKRDVLSQSPRNHSRRFMASDNFRMRRLPSFTM